MNFSQLFKTARFAFEAFLMSLIYTTMCAWFGCVVGVVGSIGIWGFYVLPYILSATPLPPAVHAAWCDTLAAWVTTGGIPLSLLIGWAIISLVALPVAALTMLVSGYLMQQQARA